MVKEVNEAAAEYLQSNKHDCIVNDEDASAIAPNNVIDSTFSLNLRQDNWIAHKLVDEFSRNEDVVFATESTNSANMSDNHAECISNESEFLPECCQQQEQVSESATSSLSKFSDEDEAELSFGTAQSEQDPSVHEDMLRDCADLENPFRASPLSNRERLTLRKQALKMRKLPMLAIGRNNNTVTGVAKTIKTHFKKHPLAIVNIKGRAKGTSVHEVIFELEQATGAVLVSREPNKVILYRGWGEGEAPPGALQEKKDAREGSSVAEDKKVSPKLMEATRVELEHICSVNCNQIHS